MKLYFLFFLLLATLTINAQITITANDVNSYYTLNNVFVNNYDTTALAVNIGQKGSFNIDFSGFTHFYQATEATVVTAASTDYANTFPDASLALKQSQTTADGPMDIFAYISITPTEIRNYGIGSKYSVSGFDVTSTSKFSPYNNSSKIPSNYLDTWTSDFIDSTHSSFGGIIITDIATHNVINYNIDGYGTVKTPDSRTLDVLRIQQQKISYSQSAGYSKQVSYHFYSKSGEQFSVTAADTLQTDNGVIQTEGIAWITRTAVGITDNNINAPGEFKLNNNYPNPFNPSTTISWYLPSESNVTISVFNAIGQKINEQIFLSQPSGSHNFTFNASSLPSGTYIYKMKAESKIDNKIFNSAGKMILMK